MAESEYIFDEEMKIDELALMYEEMKPIPDYAHLLFTPDENEALTKIRSDVLEILNVVPYDEGNNAHNSSSELHATLSPEKADFILTMLEDLGITVKGKAVVGPRQKSALRGVVEAALEESILPPIGIAASCKLIAAHIHFELKAKLNFTDTSKDYKARALEYIKHNYKTV